MIKCTRIVSKELSYKKSLLGIRTQKRLEDSLVFIAVMMLGLITFIPIFWMLRTSVMTNLEIAKYPPDIIPGRILFSNYPSAMTVFPFSRY
ncbi:MAG: hypothetical protein LBF78_15855, partial [Treponema sp.]|nr:hypothetical protein [Treponema sp.]